MKKELKLDLSESIKRLKVLTNQIINTRFVGSYKSVFRGTGLEFEDYRNYTPQDDASTIDWKASIRSKELLIREFIEERNLNVFFLIDVSSSMVYSSGNKLKIEYVAELAAALSFVVLNAGDSVGVLMFNDRVVKLIPPTQGMVQYHNIIKTLVNPEFYGGKYDLIEALKATLSYLKQNSIVMILSDFIGLHNDWERYIKIISKKYDLIGVMIKDPRDETLPGYDGQVILEDPFSNRQILIRPEVMGKLYKNDVIKHKQKIENTFLKAGADFIELTTDKPFINSVTTLFIKRVKRMR